MALPGASTAGVPDGYYIWTDRKARGGRSSFGVTVRIEGLQTVQRALKEMGGDAPFLRAALERIGEKLAGAVRAVVPYPSYKVGAPKVKGKSPALRVVVPVDHPGARSMEFGRSYYYRGYSGRAMKSGYKFKSSPGQMARPYLGIVKGNSVAESVRGYAEGEMLKAYEQEWDRLTANAGEDVIEVSA